MIRKNKFSLIALLAILLAFTSCSKEVEEAPDMGYDYMPTEQGLFISYQVQSIIWDDNNQTVDTTNYQVKMVIDTSFTDNSNRKSYRWIRYIKTDTTNWKYDHSYALTKTNELLETVEGNNRYVRLAFPVRLGSSWDLNAFNTKDKLKAQYIDVDVSKSIGGKSFNKCAIVLYEDNSSLINYYYQEDIYARNVGMVKRSNIHIYKKVSGEITKGYKYIYTVYEYGKE